jgi:hypothetical protein
MKKFLFAMTGLLFLAACGTPGPSQYLAGMMEYQGQAEQKLVADLGTPDKNYEIDGVRYLTYTKTTQPITSPTSAYSGLGFDRRRGFAPPQNFGNDPAMADSFNCDVIFTVKNKRVTKVDHRGNSC